MSHHNGLNLQPLLDWVAIESPTRHASGVNAMMDLVTAEVSDHPIGVERIAGRDGLGDALILSAGPETDAKRILVMSHLDTVHPVGTAKKDLRVRVEGDRLYGPGVYDMKGGAWLALQAFKDVARSGAAKRPLRFLFTPDEEIGSPTTRALIERKSKLACQVFVTEPAREGGKIVTARKGVGRFEVTVEGRPAHSGSRHQDGRSAIKEAARQILAIEAMTDYSRGVTVTVALINGGTAPNVIPHHAWFTIDLRVRTVADGQDLAARLLALKAHDPDIKVKVFGDMNRPPYEKSADVAALFEQARAIAGEIGFELQDCPMTGGGSDGNFSAALGVPTLDGLGIDGDGAHTLDEYGLISSIAPRRELMRRMLSL